VVCGGRQRPKDRPVTRTQNNEDSITRRNTVKYEPAIFGSRCAKVGVLNADAGTGDGLTGITDHTTGDVTLLRSGNARRQQSERAQYKSANPSRS
jgi:hypothetical protein